MKSRGKVKMILCVYAVLIFTITTALITGTFYGILIWNDAYVGDAFRVHVIGVSVISLLLILYCVCLIHRADDDRLRDMYASLKGRRRND